MAEEKKLSAQRTAATRNEIPVGIKVLLRILSVLLCLGLFASLLATTLILDFRLVTQKDTIRKVANAVFSPSVRTFHTRPMAAAVGTAVPVTTSETTGQTQQALVDWLYTTLKEQHGDELVITQDQMHSFLNQSTTKEYLTDKFASYTEDFINGTSNTTITTEEVVALIEENKALVEQELGITMDPQAWDQVIDFVEQSNIGEVVRDEVIAGVENLSIPGGSPLFPGNAPAGSDPENSGWGGSYTIGTLMADLRILTSDVALIICIAVNVMLIVALFFANRMHLSSTLCGAGIPVTILGGLLSLVTAVVTMLANVLGNFGAILSIVAGAVAPVHYGMLALGILLFIAAIVVDVLRKKAAAPANS